MNLESRITRLEWQYTPVQYNPACHMSDDEILVSTREIITRVTGKDTAAMSPQELMAEVRQALMIGD